MRAVLIFLLVATFTLAQETYTGFKTAALPYASYKDGEGYAGGGNLYLYQYGDAHRSPYVWNTIFGFKLSTEGAISSYFFLDMPQIVGDNSRFNFYVEYKSYLVDDFYGLGNNPDFNLNYINKNHPDYRDEFYYAFKQKWPGLSVSMQLPFFLPQTRHFFSLSYYHRKITAYSLPNTLQQNKPDGYDGGVTSTAQYGLIYDSRDQEAVPHNGAWSEFLAEYATPVLGSDYEYLRLTLTDRRYITVTPRLVYAQRLLFEPIFGTAPFYDKMTINGSYERQQGLGGGYSLRGIPRNLFVGQHKLLGNFELRFEMVSFTILKQHMTFYLHGFFDSGRVWLKNDPLTFNNLHSSYGVGLHGRWNKDLVGAIDVGRSAYSDLAIYVTFRNLF
jgi:outer membrane protein assembly factor BamA